MPEAKTVNQVMTSNPVCVRSDATVVDAAQLMLSSDIGDVIVVDGKAPCGIITDRDVVVRVVAAGKDPATTPVTEICSQELATVTPDTPIEKAVELMRERSIRRLPVLDGDKPVGIVSIGDLAIERDPESALADISAAPANT